MLQAPRDRIRRFIRRRRRIISAVAAGLAVAIIALPDSAPAQSTTPAPAKLAPGEVAVPVTFTTGTSSLAVGDRIELLSVTDDGQARVISRAARVMALPRSSGFGSSSEATMVAIAESDALGVTAAATTEQVTFLVHGK